MSAGMKGLGMRPAASGILLTGGALFMTLGLVSCSSNVSRFDYPMFAADQSSDSSLTTASMNPVPSEPVYQAGSGYRDSAPGYQAPPDQTVMKSDLPPPRQPYGSQPRPAGSYPPKPYAAPPQPNGAQSYPQRVASARSAASPPPRPAPVAKAPAPLPRFHRKRVVHNVRRGDTLAAIAREYDVSVADIMSANKMSNTRLSIDQKLVIPGSGGANVKTASHGTVYHVRSGDTLSSIAKKYDMDYHDLARHNGIRETTTLRLGQAIKIPVGAGGPQQPVKVASRASSVPMPSARPVRSRDSLPTPAKRRVAAKPRAKVHNASLPKPAPMLGNSFRWPVRGRVISGFGTKPNGKHNDGINVAVPLGTSVKAAENGVVAYAGSELEGYGNLVLIRHANGWVSAYAHNDQILVKRGDEVRRGQVIAKAGKTGSVSQPQVHFELRKGSQPVDPLRHLANG